MDPFLGYQLGVLVVLLWLFSNAVMGLRALLRLSSHGGRRRTSWPLVSVLVVARNSANTIVQSLESILAQTYPNFEVLVLDDRSIDRTGLMVAALAEHDLRLRLVNSKPRPAGWLDRPWACHQLAQQAAGDYLLFIEPGTALQPETLAAAVDAMEYHGGDLLSVWPGKAGRSLGERLALPLQRFLLISFLPIRLSAGRVEAYFGAVNSRFVVIHRGGYQAAGGHEAVRCDPAAGYSLARHVQGCGGRLVVLDGTDLVRSTATPNWDELWGRLSLSLFAIVNHSLLSLFAVLALFAILFVAPFGFVLSAVAAGQTSPAWLWLSLYQIAIILATGIMIAQRFGDPPGNVLLHPVAVLVLGAAVVAALWGQLARAGFGRAGGYLSASGQADDSSVVRSRRRMKQGDD